MTRDIEKIKELLFGGAPVRQYLDLPFSCGVDAKR